MDNKRNVATKTLLVLSCAFLLGLTSCTKKHHPSSDTTSSAPISETTSESTSESTSDVTTSEGTSDSTTSEVPSSDVSSESTSSEDPSSDVSSEDASSEESSSEEVLLDFGENVKLNDKTVTYNGEEQTLTVENLPEGAVVTYEGTHKFTNAGEYTIRATVSKEGYNDKVVSAKLTIAKAKVEVPTAKTNLVYTGEAIVGVEANALYTVTGGSAVEAGTHEATVTLKDTNNYEWASEFDGKVTYTIAKAEISVSGVTAPEMSVVDTGSAINFVVNGVPSNVKATVTYYSDEAMTTPVSEARGVGVYFVKVELSSTSANHTLVGTTTLTSKLTIRENNTGVTFAGDEFTYDGTAKTITVDMTNAKADGNFEVTYFSNEACTEAFTAATKAGTYTVYAKVVDKNEVYSTTVLQATLTINKVAVKVVVANKEITYNQDVPAFTYEVQGLVNGETAENVIKGTPTYTCAYAKGSNVGTYDITLTGLSTDNYELAYYKGTLTVNKAEVNVPEAKAGLVYNGTTLVGVEENALYTVTNGSATNAGTYTATVTLKDAVNYKWANAEFDGNVEFVISKADLDVSNVKVTGLGEKDATAYNGEAKVATVTGVPEGLSASVKYYSDAEHTTEVTECKNAGTYYVEVTFTQADTDNYNLASIDPIAGELIIKQKVLSVTWTGSTEYVYDGKEKAIPTCTIDEEQVITGDEVTLKVIGEPTIKFVGDYGWKLALDGAQAVNYEIDYENGSYLVSILPPERNALVNDWSTLEEGDYALVVNKDSTYYAITNNLGTSSSTIKTSNCFSFTSFEGLVFNSSSIWHISIAEEGYYISADGKYLSSALDGTKLKLADSISSATLWSMGSNERGYYFYNGDRALLFNTGGNAIGYYASSNLTSYGFVSLYKIVDNRSVDLSYEELAVEGCELSVVSSNGRLTGLYPCVDTLTINVTVPDGKILTSLTVRDADNNILETLKVSETTEGTNTIYTCNNFPLNSGKIVAEVGEALPFTVSQEENAAVTVNTTLPDNFYANTKVELSITVSEEYKLLNVIATGTSGVTYTVTHEDGTNKYSFMMPKENVTISYELEAKVLVTINAAENTSVSVSSDDGSVTNGSYVEKGTTLEISTIGTTLGYNSSFNVTGASLNAETGKYEVTDAVTITTSAKEVTDTTKISDVISAADVLNKNVSSTNQVKVTGVVISSTGYSEGYKNYDKIVISDSTGEITLFRAVKGSEGIDLIVGDTVTAIGYFVKYVSNDGSTTIYELSKNNNISPTIVSVDHIDCEITYSIVDSEENASVNAAISEIPVTAKSCSTISFSATPSSGYKIVKVTINDVEIPLVNGEYSFTVSKSNVVKVIVDVASDPVETKLTAESLDFTTKTTGNNSYNNTWTYGTNWTVSGGANNDKKWDYAKLGGKSTTLTSFSNIYLLSGKVEYAVTKVEVAIPSGSLAKSGMAVNSWSLKVYSDKDCSVEIDSIDGWKITKDAATFTFTPTSGTEWVSGCYYKVVFNLSNSSTSNGIVCISSVNLYAMK